MQCSSNIWLSSVPGLDDARHHHGQSHQFRKGDEIELAINAAKLIGLDAQISKLPLGYQTVMSDGPSAELPSGLVQRIAIARAIARRPAVLMLDEANGALDVAGDQLLASGLRRLKGFTTILIVTNRPSFAAIAERLAP